MSENLGDRLKAARKHLNLTQQKIADMLNTSTGYISEIEANKKIPGSTTLISLKSNMNINIHWLLTGEGVMFTNDAISNDNIIKVPVIDAKAAAGYGAINHHEEVVGHISFEKKYLKNELGAQTNTLNIISITGDSMDPTLKSGDLIMVDKSKNTPRTGGIYVLRQAEEIIVKRIQLLPNHKMQIYSDNSACYPSFIVDLLSDMPDFTIIGKVLLHIRKI